MINKPQAEDEKENKEFDLITEIARESMLWANNQFKKKSGYRDEKDFELFIHIYLASSINYLLTKHGEIFTRHSIRDIIRKFLENNTKG